MHPPSQLHRIVHLIPALAHLQFPLHAFPHPQWWRRAHALLSSSRMAPKVSCSRLASSPTLKRPGHLGVAALLVSRCNLPGTALERNLNSCTLFLEFAKNLFQSRGTVLSSKRNLSSPMLWFAQRMTIMYW